MQHRFSRIGLEQLRKMFLFHFRDISLNSSKLILDIALTIQNISFLKYLQPIILCGYTGINSFPSENGHFSELWFHVDTRICFL
jgi:hypothetical protein